MPARIYTESRVVADSRQYAIDRGIAVGRLVVESVADPYADYLVYDTFTDDDDVFVTDHTPDKDTEGGGWIDCGTQADLLEIISNKAQAVILNKEGECHIDCGEADVIIEADITRKNAAADNNQYGVVFRSTDFNNQWTYRYIAQTGEMWLVEKTGGVRTYHAKVAFAWDDEATHTVKIVLSGDSIICSVGGTETHDITDGTHQAVTNHGVYIYYHQNEHDTLDDFRVTAN